MKTKAQIVQELLEKNAITAEDAVVLLTPSQTTIYPHYVDPAPFFPYSPHSPHNPYVVTCGTGGKPIENTVTIN